MLEWLSTNGTIWTYGGNHLAAPERIPYIDIQFPRGFDPAAEGCGKAGCTWENLYGNVWRCYYNDSNWHDLFYNNRTSYDGDFQSSEGNFRCVGSGNTDLVTQMDGLFRECSGLVSCVTIDTSNCWHLGAMFSNCTNLIEVPYFDTHNCLDFNCFVTDCAKLEAVDTRFDTSKGKSFWYMFHNCPKLTTIPTIDLRNADDTWTSEYSSGGSYGIFSGCPSLTNIHLIGGAGISDVSWMFVMEYSYPNKPYGVLTINWENCYLPLVTDPTKAAMFETITDSQTHRPVATYSSVSSISIPNVSAIAESGGRVTCIPQAVHLGDIYIPNLQQAYTGYSLRFTNDLESIGTVTLTPSTDPSRQYNIFKSMFEGCNKLTQFPNVVMPTSPGGMEPGTSENYPNLSNMFKGVTNVGAGAYAFYQDLISKGYSDCTHSQTFSGCGSNTTAGSADLAQIPSDWK